jgi:hypothetical protein
MLRADNLSPVAGRDVEGREYCRGEVAIVGTIRAVGGIKIPIKVVDISTTGFRMECLTYLSNSQVIFLTMPSFQSMEAKIMWQTEWMYGCAFVRPLHTAVFEHIVRSHPSLGAQPTASDAFVYGAAAGLRWHRST